MFSFFKKQNLVTDISWLGIDVHSHMLPGIDDGAKTLDDSLHFITRMGNLGFHQLYFTPHIFEELYPNTQETIFGALNEVQRALNNQVLAAGAAAEYMIDHMFQVKSGLLTLPGNHILIEMSYLSESPNIEEMIFNLQVQGYKIILAHPERYNFYHKTPERLFRLKEMGCLFQLNLLSVVGYYGKNVKVAAEFLLSKKMYDVAGSDLHHHKHLDVLETSIRNGQLFKLLGGYEFKNSQYFV